MDTGDNLDNRRGYGQRWEPTNCRQAARVAYMCELDPGALAVLADRMPDVARHPDIRTLRSLPVVDVVAGGFPCQDLSQAGRTAGIGGERSGLVDHALRLVRRQRGGPRWLLLEIVLRRRAGRRPQCNRPGD